MCIREPNYCILIGEATAERIKHEIGQPFPGNEVRELEIKGRNLAQGIPRSFTLNSNEMLEARHEHGSGRGGAWEGGPWGVARRLPRRTDCLWGSSSCGLREPYSIGRHCGWRCGRSIGTYAHDSGGTGG